MNTKGLSSKPQFGVHSIMHALAVATIVVLSVSCGSNKVNKVKESVFRIVAIATDGSGYGHGTGFVINDEGCLLTNFHVAQNALKNWKTYVIRGGDDEIEVYAADLIAQDPVRDLAVVKIEDSTKIDLKPVSFNEKKPEQGVPVRAVGFPALGDNDADFLTLVRKIYDSGGKNIDNPMQLMDLTSPSISGGVLGNIKEEEWSVQGARVLAISHDAQITPGNSGGPLVNEEGQVIGVNTSYMSKNLDVDGSLVQVGAQINKASHASESLEFLRKKKIEFQESSSGAGFLLTLVIVAGAGTLAFVGARQKPKLFAILDGFGKSRRNFPQPGPKRPPMPVYDSSPGFTRPTMVSKPDEAPAQHGKAWILEGKDDEGRPVRLTVRETDLHRQGGALSLGRKREEVDLLIPSSSVSKKHARLVLERGGLVLDDCNSSNGTYVNGTALAQGGRSAPLADGASIELGETRLVLREESRPLAPPPIHEQRSYEPSQAGSVQSFCGPVGEKAVGLLVATYIFALLGGYLGLVFGIYVFVSKTVLADGRKAPKYQYSHRIAGLVGGILSLVSLICWKAAFR